MRFVFCLAVFVAASLHTLEAQEYFDKNWKRCPESKALYVAEAIDSIPGSYVVRTKKPGWLSEDYSIYTTDDFKNGKMVRFSSKGDTLVVCDYVDGMIHGAFTQNLAGHGLYKKAQYHRGKEEGATEYYFPNGQISARYQMKKGKTISSQFWNEDGSIMEDKSLATCHAVFDAESKEKFSDWVSRQLVYPKECKDINLEGTVVVRFKIDKEGRLIDLEVLESPHHLMSMEVSRIIMNSPVWKPAKSHNQLTRIVYTMPVVFRLTNRTVHANRYLK